MPFLKPDQFRDTKLIYNHECDIIGIEILVGTWKAQRSYEFIFGSNPRDRNPNGCPNQDGVP